MFFDNDVQDPYEFIVFRGLNICSSYRVSLLSLLHIITTIIIITIAAGHVVLRTPSLPSCTLACKQKQ